MEVGLRGGMEVNKVTLPPADPFVFGDFRHSTCPWGFVVVCPLVLARMEMGYILRTIFPTSLQIVYKNRGSFAYYF